MENKQAILSEQKHRHKDCTNWLDVETSKTQKQTTIAVNKSFYFIYREIKIVIQFIIQINLFSLVKLIRMIIVKLFWIIFVLLIVSDFHHI